MKKYLLVPGIIIVAIVCFFIGRATANLSLSPADVSLPLLTAPTTPTATAAKTISTCENQKCVTVTSQCSTNAECATHLACNSKEQCVAVKGAAANGCKTASDCVAATAQNATQWCKAHNTATGMTVKAVTYPNGNFSCSCSYVQGAVISETPCTDAHLNQ